MFLILLVSFGCKENTTEPTPTGEIKITQITNLTTTGVYTAKLTPTASNVLYSFSEDNGFTDEIHICDIYGNNDKRLIKMNHIYKYAISKDETKLAFLNSFNGTSGSIDELYILDVPTNQITKLSDDSGSDTVYFPEVFSSDKTKLLVTAYKNRNSVGIFNIQTKKVLILSGDISAYPIAFSKDESEVLYNSEDKLYLVNTDGTNNRVILEGYVIGYNCIGFTEDGNSIIFSALKMGTQNIYKINKDGSNLVSITNDSSYNFVNDVSTDGKSILYFSDKNSNNYLHMNVFLNENGKEKMLVGSDFDDRGVGFTNTPGKIIINRANYPTEKENLYLVEY